MHQGSTRSREATRGSARNRGHDPALSNAQATGLIGAVRGAVDRRLAKDFEASIASAKAWLYVASVQLHFRRIARHNSTYPIKIRTLNEAASNVGVDEAPQRL